jgi:hypothetical protein
MVSLCGKGNEGGLSSTEPGLMVLLYGKGVEGGLSSTEPTFGMGLMSLCGNLVSDPRNDLPSMGLCKEDELTEEVIEEGESRGVVGVGTAVMVSLSSDGYDGPPEEGGSGNFGE